MNLPIKERELFFDQCMMMGVGQMPIRHPAAPFAVHRYEDAWWLMNDFPSGTPAGLLGLEFETDDALRDFIVNLKNSGRPITTKDIL